MKFSLTINTDNPADIAAVVAALGGSTAISTGVVPMNGTHTDDEDDNAPAAEVQPGEVDAAGLPWDERIHSGKKTKTAAGNWRYRKGVNENTVTAVEAELRARVAGTPSLPPPMFDAGNNQQPPAAPVAPAPVAAPPVAPAPVAAPPVAPAPAPAPAPAAPSLQPIAEGALDFGGLMQVISTAMTTDIGGGVKKLPEARLAELCGLFGVQQIAQIANNPLHIAQAYNWLLDQKLIVGT